MHEPLDRSVENSLPQLEGSSLAMNDASVESSPPMSFVDRSYQGICRSRFTLLPRHLLSPQ